MEGYNLRSNPTPSQKAAEAAAAKKSNPTNDMLARLEAAKTAAPTGSLFSTSGRDNTGLAGLLKKTGFGGRKRRKTRKGGKRTTRSRRRRSN
jgi:hypothetical protein